MAKASVPVSWPASASEIRAISLLAPNARNARLHTPEQVNKIAASIREFGWTIPALIDESNTLIAGHGRVLAAAQLGIASVPVVVARGWTEAQKRAYMIADNQLTLDSSWDQNILRVEIAELQALDFNLDLLGFEAPELKLIMAGETALPPRLPNGSLMDRFMIAPFSVMSAREGWWQNRKRLWLAMGIQSELGRGETGAPNAALGGSPRPLDRAKDKAAKKAAPGGSPMPAADYSERKRGDGRGRSIKETASG